MESRNGKQGLKVRDLFLCVSGAYMVGNTCMYEYLWGSEVDTLHLLVTLLFNEARSLAES